MTRKKLTENIEPRMIELSNSECSALDRAVPCAHCGHLHLFHELPLGSRSPFFGDCTLCPCRDGHADTPKGPF